MNVGALPCRLLCSAHKSALIAHTKQRSPRAYEPTRSSHQTGADNTSSVGRGDKSGDTRVIGTRRPRPLALVAAALGGLFVCSMCLARALDNSLCNTMSSGSPYDPTAAASAHSSAALSSLTRFSDCPPDSDTAPAARSSLLTAAPLTRLSRVRRFQNPNNHRVGEQQRQMRSTNRIITLLHRCEASSIA